MKKSNLILCIFLVAALGFAFRQSSTYTTLANLYSPEIQFELDIHDFGKLDSASSAKYYFRYKNIGNKELIIDDLSSACGCTIADWNPRPLVPGGSDSLLVTYDTNITGYFMREIVIKSNSKTSPDRIYIKGFVDVSRISPNNS